MSRKYSSNAGVYATGANEKKYTMFAGPFSVAQWPVTVCECLGMCPCPCAVEPVTRIRAPTRAQYAMSDPSAPECGDRQEIGRSEINMRSQHEIVDASRPPLAPVRAGSCATARTGSCAPPGAYAYDGLLTGVTTAVTAVTTMGS